MCYEPYEDFQYNSCVSRGICSLSPRSSALQTVLVLYLRLFAKYALNQEIEQNDKDFILNAVSITIYNPDFNENTFFSLVNEFKKLLPKIICKFSEVNPLINMDEEKQKAEELFAATDEITNAIKYGEKIFNRGVENISVEIRDLYNIMLVIAKSISINLLDLKSYDEDSIEAFDAILDVFRKINLEEKDIITLKSRIYSISEINNNIMSTLRQKQEERYGYQFAAEVSYTTIPSKAVLVVGSNIRELEMVLEKVKGEEIDVYTHDEMMLAHTFPKFSQYSHLRGQFGQGLESCLLDFATFPGPIVLTKHSLHNIENLYRGRLFTTDYASSKGVIKIENNDFTSLIEAAKNSRGFKSGKQCETVSIGYNYEEAIQKIKNEIDSRKYERIFFIGLDGYSLEQRAYFEKLVKHTPDNILIISFFHNIDKNNLIFLNSCFDSYGPLKVFDFVEKFDLKIDFFFPQCARDSVSQIVYLSSYEKVRVYVGKCAPIILNPSLMSTLQKLFNIKTLTSAKKDLEEILSR